MTNKHGFWRYQFPAIGWAGLIFGLSSLPSSVITIPTPIHIDKAFHAAIFFVFCLLLNRAFLNQRHMPALSRHHLIISLLVVIVYGITDEMHQTVVPGRSPDFYDALADSLGGAVYILYLLLSKFQANRRANSTQKSESGNP